MGYLDEADYNQLRNDIDIKTNRLEHKVFEWQKIFNIEY